MPGPAIGVDPRIGRLSQRLVRGPPLGRPGAARYTADRTSGYRNTTRSPIASNPASAAGASAPVAIPSRSAARHTSAGSPVGSAAATSIWRPCNAFSLELIIIRQMSDATTYGCLRYDIHARFGARRCVCRVDSRNPLDSS